MITELESIGCKQSSMIGKRRETKKCLLAGHMARRSAPASVKHLCLVSMALMRVICNVCMKRNMVRHSRLLAAYKAQGSVSADVKR